MHAYTHARARAHTHSVDPKGCQLLRRVLRDCLLLLSVVCIAVHVRVYVCVLFGGTLRLAPNKGRPVTPSPGSVLAIRQVLFPPSGDHKYVDLPDKVSSAWCGCRSVDVHVCGGQWTCMYVNVCLHCYCTCINVLMSFIMYSLLLLLAKLLVLSSHMTVTWTSGVTCHLCMWFVFATK